MAYVPPVVAPGQYGTIATVGPPVAAGGPVVVEQTTTTASRWTATDIIAWVTFFILIILIIVFVFVFFFSSSSTSQTVEFFGANYQFLPNPTDVTQPVITSGNTIYLIPTGTASGTSITVSPNNFNNSGRTFLIKNNSSNPVTLTPGTGVTLYHLDGTTGTDTLAADSLAMYITYYSNPNNTFQRLL